MKIHFSLIKKHFAQSINGNELKKLFIKDYSLKTDYRYLLKAFLFLKKTILE